MSPSKNASGETNSQLSAATQNEGFEYHPVAAPISRLELKHQDVPSYEQYWKNERHTKYPKRLIVCCDGTWMASDKEKETRPSNVARISRLISNEGTGHLYDKSTKKNVEYTMAQIVYYQSGVGAGNHKLPHNILQGMFGRTLNSNLIAAYNFLCTNYAPGDEIFLFGFSRGAYTARALAGLITGCGIMRPGAMDEFYAMYKSWRHRVPGSDFSQSAWYKSNQARLRLIRIHNSIKFLGVWDTVGALGIPRSLLEWVGLKDMRYEFHEVGLNDKIARAAHAISIDENRVDFCPTLWFHKKDSKPATTNLIQCWFPGYHSDIGGGNEAPANHIEDITLAWMIDQLGELLYFAPKEIDRFVEEAVKHGWGEGALQPSGMSSFYGFIPKGLQNRTPGEYESPRANAKTEQYETNEFMHPVVRYRMNIMAQKRKKSAADDHGPLKPFGKPLYDKAHHRFNWRKKAAHGSGEVVIPEYQIPAAKGSKYVCLGLERRIVPKIIMAELDSENGFSH